MRVYAIIALLAAIALASVAVYNAGVQSERGRNLIALNTLKLKLEKERDSKQVEINLLTKSWLNKGPEIEYKYRTIIKEVPGAVRDNSDCELSVDAIRLLNRAARDGMSRNDIRSVPVD